MDIECDDGAAPDLEMLQRRAKLCREQARATDHPSLAEAFQNLAQALEVAAAVAEMRSQRTLH